ncbi:MAG: ribulokinase [Solirubrobacterales bacterium]|nr:ribulokinase [Solirubrobacterales bacterium]
MNERSYAIGVDFGTESARALLLDLRTGEELAVSVASYPHGVIDELLPASGERLPPDWALQDPDDWKLALERSVSGVLSDSAVPPAAISGLGVDFTSCTVLPVMGDGAPLCTLPAWRARRNAWPKLWKHHAAQPVADRLTEVALEREEEFIARYGGRISSEWYFPKLIELWLEDRECYETADGFIEGTDWIVWHLTGRERRQRCTAGYKALWSPETGLPPVEYFAAAYAGFDRPAEKLGNSFLPLGSRAGTIRPEVAARLGLRPDTPVAVGNVDSFASVPGAGVSEPGTFVSVVGTSICDMVVDRKEVRLPGITGVVKDGILPGRYGYEAGQAAVGDMLAWFVRHVAPPGAGHASLERAAAALRPGETGLVALDWWNGNRTVLADADLTGVVCGLTLHSTREHIYRALLEAIAFGNRRIVENFTEHGIPLTEIVACGGVANSSALLMQLFADISGLEVRVPGSKEVPARGSALFAAVAGGAFECIDAAVAATEPPTARTYRPDPTVRETYDRLYSVYRGLHDLLGSKRVELLHGLKQIRLQGSAA